MNVKLYFIKEVIKFEEVFVNINIQ